MSALNYNAIRLFKIMLARAKEGRPGLTVSAYCNALDIDDRDIVIDSLDRLEKAEMIRMDIRGERPALIILRGHHRSPKPLDRPLILRMAPFAVVSTPGVEPAPIEYTDMVQELAASEPPIELPPCVMEGPALARFPIPHAKRDGQQVTFRVDHDDYEWLQEMLDMEADPLSMSGFVRRIFMTELDRIRTDGMGKHRLSAAVLRTAREDGQPLDQFVTNLIDSGLMAYRAGRAER